MLLSCSSFIVFLVRKKAYLWIIPWIPSWSLLYFFLKWNRPLWLLYAQAAQLSFVHSPPKDEVHGRMKKWPQKRGGSVNQPWHPALLSSPSTGTRQQAGLFMPWLLLMKHSLCVLISYLWRRNRFRERHTYVLFPHIDIYRSCYLFYLFSFSFIGTVKQAPCLRASS